MIAKGIIVAVGAVIQDKDDRILLVKHRPRRRGFWQGKWICPGGKLEFGEKIEDGIRREVKEETNLEIKLITSLIPFDRIVKSGERSGLHVIYIDYLARATGGELKPGSDVGEARWVPRRNIRDIWEELHEDTQKLLQIANII